MLDFIKNLFISKKVEQRIESNNSSNSINVIGNNNTVSNGSTITFEENENDEYYSLRIK